MDSQEKLFFAKIVALKTQPYLKSIISTMKAVQIDNFPELTISVDTDWNLNYNTAFIDSLEVNECAALILHEAYHIVYNHSERFLNYKLPNSTHGLWNEAGDAVINSQLIESGVDFGSLSPIVAGKYSKYPKWLEGQATEEMFFSVYSGGESSEDNNNNSGSEEKATNEERGEDDNLKSEQTKTDSQNENEQDANSEEGNPDGNSGDEENKSSSSSKPDEKEDKGNTDEGVSSSSDPSNGDAESKNDEGADGSSSDQRDDDAESGNDDVPSAEKKPTDPGKGDCGSIADGVKRSWEGTSDDQQSLEEHDKTLSINKLTKDVLEAEQHTPGTVPGGMFEQLNSINNSHINWSKILERKIRTKFATVSGARNYTYSRPSRRSIKIQNSDKKIFTPAIRGYKKPSIAFVLDTSGSMDKKDLAQALGEIDKIVKDLRIRSVDVVQCDTAAHVYRKVKSVKKLIPHGRGGTNMSEGIKAVAENIKPVPDIIVIVTDGFTPWPKKPYPILRHTAHIACIVSPKSQSVSNTSDIISRVNTPNYISVIPVIF